MCYLIRNAIHTHEPNCTVSLWVDHVWVLPAKPIHMPKIWLFLPFYTFLALETNGCHRRDVNYNQEYCTYIMTVSSHHWLSRSNCNIMDSIEATNLLIRNVRCFIHNLSCDRRFIWLGASICTAEAFCVPGSISAWTLQWISEPTDCIGHKIVVHLSDKVVDKRHIGALVKGCRWIPGRFAENYFQTFILEDLKASVLHPSILGLHTAFSACQS